MSLILQLELALHDADCPGHDENFTGHGDKYEKLAHAAFHVLPPEHEPYWLRDRKMIQEASLDLIIKELRNISNRVGA